MAAPRNVYLPWTYPEGPLAWAWDWLCFSVAMRIPPCRGDVLERIEGFMLPFAGAWAFAPERAELRDLGDDFDQGEF